MLLNKLILLVENQLESHMNPTSPISKTMPLLKTIPIQFPDVVMPILPLPMPLTTKNWKKIHPTQLWLIYLQFHQSLMIFFMRFVIYLQPKENSNQVILMLMFLEMFFKNATLNSKRPGPDHLRVTRLLFSIADLIPRRK